MSEVVKCSPRKHMICMNSLKNWISQLYHHQTNILKLIIIANINVDCVCFQLILVPQYYYSLDLQAEISLCRVYKRAGVEDHPPLPRSLIPTTARNSPSSSSRGPAQPPRNHHHDPDPDQASKSQRKGDNSFTIAPLIPNMASAINIPPPPTSLKDPNCIFDNSNSSSQPNNIDDLHKLVNTNYSSQQASLPNLENNVPNLLSHFSPLPPPPPVALDVVPGSFQAAFSDRLWDWNGIPEASKDFNNLFK